MNIKNKYVIAVLASSALFNVEASQVGTPFASAKATIDWSSLSVTAYSIATNTNQNINWENQNSSVNIYKPNPLFDLQTESVNNWSSTISKSNLSAESTASSALLTTYSNDNGVNSVNNEIAVTTREGRFTVADNGFLFLSLNYILDVTLVSGPETSWIPGGHGGYDENYASATVSLAVEKGLHLNDNFQVNISDGDAIYLNSYSAFTSPIHYQGTLFLSTMVNANQIITVRSEANSRASVSSVPVPSAVWMFLSALMGVLRITKRRQ